jgi:hypothetical protein
MKRIVRCKREINNVLPGDIIHQGDNQFEYCQNFANKRMPYIYRPINPIDKELFLKEYSKGKIIPEFLIKRIG